MLFTQTALESIAAGTITLAFRRWRVVRVRAGSTQRTALGVVGITSVVAVDLEDITADDARNAGFETLRSLIDQLARSGDAQVYRVGLRFEGEDRRVALRMRAKLSEQDRDELLARVTRMGARSADGAWAVRTLRLIESHPATRAAKLARIMGMETQRFKTRVRQLKDLGLTESLDIGYRLSPRGLAFLRWLTGATPRDQSSADAPPNAANGSTATK